MRKIAAISLALIIMALPACGRKTPPNSPERTVQRLETAIQNIDVEGALDCIEPRTSKGLRSTINMVGGTLGIESEDIFNFLPFALDIGKAANVTGTGDLAEAFESVRIEVLSVDYNDDESAAEVDVEISLGGESESYAVKMVNIEDEWYIKLF